MGFYKAFVEHAHHHLLGRAREELPAQVQVVGSGVLQVRVSLLLIFLVDDAVRHNLEEAGTVDGAGIAEMQSHVGAEVVFGVQVR